MKWKCPTPVGVAPGASSVAPSVAPGECAWLCPGWEVSAGFCTAWEGPSPAEAAVEAGVEAWAAGVAQACRRLNALAGLGEAAAWAFLKQVHGVALKKAEGLNPGEAHCLGEADGAWTEQPGVALAVQTADCVPLLLLDGRRRRVAALHAGWRGVWGRIVLEQLKAWHTEGSRLGEVEVALGPSIGPCCYEVSEALAQSFSDRWGKAVVSRPQGTQAQGALGPRVDLAKALELDIVGAGVSPERLQNARVCTFCDARFHSYRRAAGRAGRQLSWVHLGSP